MSPKPPEMLGFCTKGLGHQERKLGYDQAAGILKRLLAAEWIMDWRNQALIFTLSLLTSDLTFIPEKAESSAQHWYQFFLLFISGTFYCKNGSPFVQAFVF